MQASSMGLIKGDTRSLDYSPGSSGAKEDKSEKTM